MAEKDLNYSTTTEIKVPDKLIDQVIGQDRAVELVKKAAKQRRNVLLIGEPGTGKSLLAKGMADIMPVDKLDDILIYPNKIDSHTPIVKVLHGGEGKKIVEKMTLDEKAQKDSMRFVSLILPLGWFILSAIAWRRVWISDVIFAAALIVGSFFVAASVLSGQLRMPFKVVTPKLLIDNSKKNKAPFVDGTGSKAGALFGDVKHDPLQTIFSQTVVYIKNQGKLESVILQNVVDNIFKKYPDLIETNNEGYEGLVLPKNEKIYTLGYISGKIKPVRILCVNRKKYDGKMYGVRYDSKRVLVTPEHKIYVNNKYIEANKLNGKEKMVTFLNPILTKENIINTFSKQDQISAQKYFEFLELKKENPKFGYKKIAKLLKIKDGQTRWWNNKKNKPKPVRTIERLEDLNLLPFKLTDNRLDSISRILGTTFGDGGIFSTLNAIFLSSAEKQSIADYKSDLVKIFGKSIVKNFDERAGGINKSSKCIRNTNRDIIRFFVALGAPVGRKNKGELKVPDWIYLSEEAQKNFFGAFLGNELCSPKFSDKSLQIQEFGVASCGTYDFKKNRLDFLASVSKYLNSYGIETTNSIYENNFREKSFMWKLSISKNIENLMKFSKFIPIYYSENKKKRLGEAIIKTIDHKIDYIYKLKQDGKSEKYILSTLRISSEGYKNLKQNKKFDFCDNVIDIKDTIYNVTTESGNVFANGLLISNSGGLGTPPHLRVIPGMIHRANKGVLFLDEIATLSPKSQQDLLTAMQEKKAAITGQSELSSGAMVRTESVPCDFVLVAAGNYESLQHLHPAIRSRIRGYGYEVYMNVDMDDIPENRNKIVRFVAQEIKNDGKIPQFNKEAVEFIIFEARRRANSKKKLSLKFRELGGLIRAAGDIAVEKGKKIVDIEDMLEAKKSAKTLEEQMIGKYISRVKDYSVFSTKGKEVGRVNGLAVLSDGETGTIISIEADVAPAQSKSEGKIYATGKLGEIAKEAVLNVSSIIKKVSNTDLSSHDIHIQFLQSYSGVEGDSASIAITTAVISAIEGIPVRQDIAMTGSLSVKGKVMPVGGVTAKVKAALDAGFRTVIVPKQNVEDIVLTEDDKKKVRIISVNNLYDVLSNVFEDGKQMDIFLKKLKKELE